MYSRKSVSEYICVKLYFSLINKVLYILPSFMNYNLEKTKLGGKYLSFETIVVPWLINQ